MIFDFANRKRRALLAGAPCIFASALAAAAAAAQCPTDAQVTAYVHQFARARATEGFGGELSRADAECAKRKLVQQLQAVHGPIVGYKAAFTNPAVQQRFGVDAPAWGAMFANGIVHSDVQFRPGFAARPIYEADLIAVVKDPALAQATTPLEALRHIEAIATFIEVPDLMLLGDGLPRGTEHIATNVGFRYGVRGPSIQAEATEAFLDSLARMTVVTTELRSGKELGRAPGSALLQNPINSVLWLAHALKKDGIALKRGDLLSLGGFIPPVAAQPDTIIQVQYLGLPGDPVAVARFE